VSISSGTRNVVAEAGMWLAAAIILALSIVYFEELKGVFGVALKSAHTQVAAPARPTPQPANPVSSPKTPLSFGNIVELAAGPNGHFFADADVNGRRIRVMVDTGASLVALSHEDASRAGIYVRPSDFKYRVSTANGPARIAIVKLDRVSIEGITVYDVRAAVGERGALRTTLLGMSFLSKLKRTEMRNGRLVLEN
jgi:aspartyl protease family protein